MEEKISFVSNLRCPHCGDRYKYEACEDSLLYYCKKHSCGMKQIEAGGTNSNLIDIRDLAAVLNCIIEEEK